ncbi:hypothetical protein JCM10450v2_000331 [Rhodotorula kratochvilovae]
MPDPLDASSFNHRFVTVPSGHRYHLIDEHPAHWRGPVEQAPTILMAHGFPDLWYGWRYQIAAFAARGYRVICPSQLGYGGTTQSDRIEDYSYKSVAYDMNGLLDAVGAGKVIVFGHDWGGMVAWRFADYFPHRVLCLASVCTPYLPASQPGQPLFTEEELVRNKLPNFGYQLFFKTEAASRKLDEALEQFITVGFSAPVRAKLREAGREIPQMEVEEGALEKRVDQMIETKRKGEAPPLPTDPEYLYYLSTFRKYGMHHPLNWYRNRRVCALDERASRLPPTFPADIPALLLPAELDSALPPSMADPKKMRRMFPGGNLRVEVLKGADHWVLQDAPFRDAVTEKLAAFVEEVLAGKWQPDAPASKL